MVLIDANTLLLLINPDAAVPNDASGKQITFAKERVDGLIQDLSKQKQKIIIPTPVLSEVFVRTDYNSALSYVERFKKDRNFRVEPFCERAAIEVALMTAKAIANGNKKDGSDEKWAKVKYDRQIVAIAAVHSVSTIYTDDRNLKSFGTLHGFKVIGIGELPIPDEKAQLDFISDSDT
jgi:predicted nucleic acid-binding protein